MTVNRNKRPGQKDNFGPILRLPTMRIKRIRPTSHQDLIHQTAQERLEKEGDRDLEESDHQKTEEQFAAPPHLLTEPEEDKAPPARQDRCPQRPGRSLVEHDLTGLPAVCP